MNTIPVEWNAQEDRNSHACPPPAGEGRVPPPLGADVRCLCRHRAGGACGGDRAAKEIHGEHERSSSRKANIIGPLMEGRAVPTGVANRAGIAKQVAFSQQGDERDPPRRRLDGRQARPARPGEAGRPDHGSHPHYQSAGKPDRDRIHRLRPPPRVCCHPAPGRLVHQESLANKERESRQAYGSSIPRSGNTTRSSPRPNRNLEQYRRSNPDARPATETDVKRTHRRVAPPGRVLAHGPAGPALTGRRAANPSFRAGARSARCRRARARSACDWRNCNPSATDCC